MVTCTFHKSAVALLLSEKHRPLVAHYALKLEQDPHFLVYHSLSVTTTLRRELLFDNVGPSGTHHCFEHSINECHIIDALEEALRRYTAEKKGRGMAAAQKNGSGSAANGEQSD